MNGHDVLAHLLEGNRRFVADAPLGHVYGPPKLAELAAKQEPIAAIVGCSDARVSPEIIFDQPLGAIFASRVPGNVASDSAKWMIDIAIQEFRVPLILVLGHTGCLAVGQLLDGDRGGAGGSLRYDVLRAVHRAKLKDPVDLHLAAVEENVRQTVLTLSRDSPRLREHLMDHTTVVAGAVYDMPSGTVRTLWTMDDPYDVI